LTFGRSSPGAQGFGCISQPSIDDVTLSTTSLTICPIAFAAFVAVFRMDLPLELLAFIIYAAVVATSAAAAIPVTVFAVFLLFIALLLKAEYIVKRDQLFTSLILLPRYFVKTPVFFCQIFSTLFTLMPFYTSALFVYYDKVNLLFKTFIDCYM